MKIIFLDWDGVCNNDASLEVSYAVGCPTWAADINCINLLRDLVMKTGAKIVLSSSWRGEPNKEMSPEYFLRAVLSWWGLRIFDRTPRKLSRHDRSEDICQWLMDAEERKLHIESFVIFDDREDAGTLFPKYFVRTNPATGLTRADTSLAEYIFLNRTAPTSLT